MDTHGSDYKLTASRLGLLAISWGSNIDLGARGDATARLRILQLTLLDDFVAFYKERVNKAVLIGDTFEDGLECPVYIGSVQGGSLNEEQAMLLYTIT